MVKIDNSRVDKLLSADNAKSIHSRAFFSSEDHSEIRALYRKGMNGIVLHGRAFTITPVGEDALFVKPVIGYAPCCRISVR